jgi:ABC-type transport system substrate-binding protein
MNGLDGLTRPAYQELAGWLSQVPPDILQHRRREAELLFRRIGITFAVYGDSDSTERLIPFDVIPRVIAANEWDIVKRGLEQRTKAINLYFVSLLRKLGYKASIKTLNSSVQYSYVQDSANKAQLSFSYWYPDYTSASNFMTTVVGCDGFRPHSTSSPNLSEFCDPAIQKKTEQALKLAQTDQDGANKLWAEVDKDTTDQAPLVTLFINNRLDFVSKRLGNFQFNGSVTGNFMIDQAWVQ